MADGTKDADTTQRDPLGVRWIHGSPPGGPADPKVQVVAYDEDTFILRQSKSVNYEAPFLFLLFGNDRALLLDTGATADPERFPLRAHRRPAHRALAGRAPARRVRAGRRAHPRARRPRGGRRPVRGPPGHHGGPRDVEAVRSFFGFDDGWPERTVAFDLGGRVLEVLGSPGHHAAAITVYDPWTGILLTGDTVCPGGCTSSTSRRSWRPWSGWSRSPGPRPVTPRPRLPRRDDRPARPRLPDRRHLPAGRARRCR